MTPDQLRSRVAVYLLTALGPDWVEAPGPYQLFPTTLARTKLHRALSVGLGTSEAVQGHGSRQAQGVVCETEVNIRFSFRVRAEVGPSDRDNLSDVDAALAAEADIVSAILRAKGQPSEPGVALRFARVVGRDIVGDGTVWLGEIRTVALHVYPAALP